MKMNRVKLAVTLTRWLARGLAVCVFLLWGAFFVEHLLEWFVKPFPNHPPLKVCAAMALHFLMLAGLLLALRWKVAGGLLAIAAAFTFFYHISGSPISLYFGLTALPAVLLLLCWSLDRRSARQSV